MPTTRGMDKEDVIHVHSGILLSHKNNKNNAISINIDESRDYTKGSQRKTDII